MEQVKREDAERFARVWQRVMPEGNSTIVPVPPEEAGSAGELSTPMIQEAALLVMEQAVQREARRLWQRTGGEGFAHLVRGSAERARRLRAAAFLVTGTRPAAPRRPETSGGGLPALYRGLLEVEDGYRALLERAEDPVLIGLYDALAERCREDRRRVLCLAAGRGG